MSLVAEDLDSARRQSTVLKEKLQSLMNGHNQADITRHFESSKASSAKAPEQHAATTQNATANLRNAEVVHRGPDVDSDSELGANDENKEPVPQRNRQTAAGNYFEDFKARVHEIRSRQFKPAKTVVFDQPGERHPHMAADSGDEELLLAKIDRQSAQIERLEEVVRELKLQNSRLNIVASALPVANSGAPIEQGLKATAPPQAVSRPDGPTEREVYRHLQVENQQLKERLNLMAQRSQALAEIHRHRQTRLQEKAQASLDVCRSLTASAASAADDDTAELLYGPREDSTMQLLQGLVPEPSRKRKLRSCFVAVLFMVRMQRAAAAERAWLQTAV